MTNQTNCCKRNAIFKINLSDFYSVDIESASKAEDEKSFFFFFSFMKSKSMFDPTASRAAFTFTGMDCWHAPVLEGSTEVMTYIFSKTLTLFRR